MTLTGMDGTDHAVTTEAMSAGRSARCVAVCGLVVELAALVTPPGHPCLACRVALGEFPSPVDLRLPVGHDLSDLSGARSEKCALTVP